MSEQRIIVLADSHLGKYWKSNNSTFNRGRKLIDNFINNLYQILDEYKNDNKKPILIIAGDVYDSIHANAEMLVYIKTKLSKVLNEFDKVYVIAGNHETFIDRNGKQQSLLTIGLDSNIKVIVNGIYNEKILGKNYIFIPFQNNLEELLENELLNHMSISLSNILVFHMTPKEIFSYSKYSIDQLIDKLKDMKYKVPYILLGHYHKACDHSYRRTNVISIGNTYYTAIDEIRDNLTKRYLSISDNQVESVEFKMLPRIIRINVDSQEKFNIISDNIENVAKIEDIIYLSSNVLIDYSNLTFRGYDIYFDLLEDTNDDLIVLHETLTDSLSDNTTGKTLDERWNRYLEIITENGLTSQEKELATILFNKRNDLDLNIDIIKNFLNIKGE